MRIYVHSHDLGFLSEQPVTVQRFEIYEDDGEISRELVWCNHAETEDQSNEVTIDRYEQGDLTYFTHTTVCLKCGAYQLDEAGYWYEAPMEGVSNVVSTI